MSFASGTAYLLSLGILLSSGILGSTNASARDVPAVIVRPTNDSRLALRQVVSNALKRESVVLSNEALTQTSTLIIEPVRVRDPQGNVIYDRDVRVLEHFRLVRSWGRCILIRESTGERFKLAHTQCVAKT